MSWISVPMDRELGPRVEKIMNAVYADRGLSLGAPIRMDHWWHTPKVSYQVNPGALEPSICIINLTEGERDFPSQSTHFMINLNTYRIHDKFKDVRFPAPASITQDLDFVYNYVKNKVRKEAEERENARRREQERQEKERREKNEGIQVGGTMLFLPFYTKRETIKAFRSRLLAHGLLEEQTVDPTLALPETCPICKEARLLGKCCDCKLRFCLNSQCHANEMDSPAHCYSADHARRVYCKACRGEGETAKLLQCPEEDCTHWMCREDWRWCIGRPLKDITESGSTPPSQVAADHVASGPSTGDVEPPSKRRKLMTCSRSLHAKKLMPCSSCLDATIRVCKNQHCWSKLPHGSSGTGVVCKECSPDEGLSCAKADTWVCDDCGHASSAEKFPLIWTCPNCEELICSDCGEARRCGACGISEWCGMCREGYDRNGEDEEEDEKGGEEEESQPEARKLTFACSLCDQAFCRQCLLADKNAREQSKDQGTERVKQQPLTDTCAKCYEEFCFDCAHGDKCADYDDNLCLECEQCRCGGYSKSKMEQMIMEAYYEDECYYDDFY